MSAAAEAAVATHDVRVEALGDVLAELLGGGAARVEGLQPLAGGDGAWLALDVAVGAGAGATRHALVLRAGRERDAASAAERHALLEAAHLAGVRVAEPLGWCDDDSIVGRPFHVTRRLGGAPPDGAWPAPARVRLLASLGATLARLHRIGPPWPGLDFLAEPEPSAALARVGEMRWRLDRAGRRDPALEWALRWLERNAPPPGRLVLGHGTLRAANCLAAGGTLSGLVGWGRAAWSEPLEDVAALVEGAGGFGCPGDETAHDELLGALRRGYEAEAGAELELADLPYWEVMTAFAPLVDRAVAPAGAALRDVLEGLSRLEAARSLTLVARRSSDARQRLAQARASWLDGLRAAAVAPGGAIERFAALYGEDVVAASAAGDAERLRAMNDRFARDIRDGTFDGACAQAARVQIVEQLRDLHNRSADGGT